MAALQQPHLLWLPRELRDKIYVEYLSIDNGYVYVFDQGKLRASDPAQRIELNLMYTCRLVADEMRGLPLRLNAITFRTLCSEDISRRAGRWAYFCIRAESWERYSLGTLIRRMKTEVFNGLIRRFGDRFFSADLRRERNDDPRQNYYFGTGKRHSGEVPSVYREAARDVIRIAMTDPNIREYLSSDEYLVRVCLDFYHTHLNTNTYRR